MIEEIEKNLFRIGVPLPNSPLRELNSYFIRSDGRELLIDTGFRTPECRKALADALTELGSEPGRRDVLATHVHADHSGMVDLFVGPGRRIYMSGADLNSLRRMIAGSAVKSRSQRYLEEGFPPRTEEELLFGNPAHRRLVSAVTGAFAALEDGDTISVGDYTLKTVLVPGHTPGNAMFWCERQGIMFCGDHILFDITPNITTWPTMDDALGSYLDSLRRAKEYPVRLALPGHRSGGDYAERIDQLSEHHELRLREILQLLADYPGSTAYQLTALMHWNLRSDGWDAVPATQKWFAMGECLSHLDYLRKRGRVDRELVGGVWRYRIP